MFTNSSTTKSFISVSNASRTSRRLVSLNELICFAMRRTDPCEKFVSFLMAMLSPTV